MKSEFRQKKSQIFRKLIQEIFKFFEKEKFFGKPKTRFCSDKKNRLVGALIDWVNILQYSSHTETHKDFIISDILSLSLYNGIYVLLHHFSCQKNLLLTIYIFFINPQIYYRNKTDIISHKKNSFCKW